VESTNHLFLQSMWLNETYSLCFPPLVSYAFTSWSIWVDLDVAYMPWYFRHSTILYHSLEILGC
jgi:hypothetical protein